MAECEPYSTAHVDHGCHAWLMQFGGVQEHKETMRLLPLWLLGEELLGAKRRGFPGLQELGLSILGWQGFTCASLFLSSAYFNTMHPASALASWALDKDLLMHVTHHIPKIEAGWDPVRFVTEPLSCWHRKPKGKPSFGSRDFERHTELGWFLLACTLA